MNLEDLTLTQVAASIRDGSVSPVEYVQALLGRIDKLESELHAWITIDRDRVIEDAESCETEAKAGRFRGPLHGVPVGLKDIFFTKDLRTTAGARFLQTFTPGYDAACVTHLRQAGAIILGKTVTTEFATFDPGPTRNPRNPEHTPGGSSSGSAAAVAARMCPAATGTQTVGSVGRPAAYCGIVGFMPTQSRISRVGIFPVSWSVDHVGGFTRSVSDARLLLEGLAGESLEPFRPAETVRVGVLRGFFSTNASEETRAIHESTLKRLNRPPFVFEEAVLPPIFDFQSAILTTILRCEIASAHSGFHRYNSSLYSAKLRGLVETGMIIESLDYLRALRLRRVYQREMGRLFEKFDVLVSPGATGTAPSGLSYTGDPGFSGPWSLADFPTLTLPSAVASNGLPLGIQITSPSMSESLLFAVGTLIEQIL